MKGTILYLVGLNVKLFEAKLLRPREKANKKEVTLKKFPNVWYLEVFLETCLSDSLRQINIKMHNNALHTHNVWMLGCLHIYTRRWILGWCINLWV